MKKYLSEDNIPKIKKEIAAKQDKLVSGTNIKTINNTSLLGSGNIEIKSGGSDVPYILGGSSANLLSLTMTDWGEDLDDNYLNYSLTNNGSTTTGKLAIPNAYYHAGNAKDDSPLNHGGLMSKNMAKEHAESYHTSPSKCWLTATRPSWGDTAPSSGQYYYIDNTDLDPKNQFPYDIYNKYSNVYIGGEAYVAFDADSTPGKNISISVRWASGIYTNQIYVPDTNGELQPLRNVKANRFYHIVMSLYGSGYNERKIFICDNANAIEPKEWELIREETISSSGFGAASALPINSYEFSDYKRIKVKFHGKDGTSSHDVAPCVEAYYDSSGWFDLVYHKWNGVGQTAYNSSSTAATYQACFWNNVQQGLRSPNLTSKVTAVGYSDGEVIFTFTPDGLLKVSGWISHNQINNGSSLSPAAYVYNYCTGAATANKSASTRIDTVCITGSFDAGSYYSVWGSKY